MMRSSLKWILKNQLGWILGAGFILIYTQAQAQTYSDLATPYKYVVPGNEILESGSELQAVKTITGQVVFKPVPKSDTPSQMAVAQQLAVAQQSFKDIKPEKAIDEKPTTTVPKDKEIKASTTKIDPVVSAKPVAKVTKISSEKEPEFLGSPVWGRSKERDRWSRAVLEVVRANKRTLDRARDVETFCPGYKKATTRAQEMCWLVVMSAISKKESDFKPGTSFQEPSGEYSVGLLAMSGHQCRNAPTIKALKNPVENVKCGTRLMVKLVGRAGYISSGKSGGAANWSVLRKPYSIIYRGKRLRLGKISEILAMTKPKFKSVLRESAKHQEKARLAKEAAAAEAAQLAAEQKALEQKSASEDGPGELVSGGVQ